MITFLNQFPDKTGMNKRIDLDTQNSHHHGLKGFFERLLRKFKAATHVLTLIPVYLLSSFILGLCIAPGVQVFNALKTWTSTSSPWMQNISLGVGLALGYFTYGLTLLFIVPMFNFILRTNLKAWRGPYYSAESVKWYLHNGLTYLARYTFLEFATPSPLSQLFYKMMGMKVGRSVVINSTWISDPSLIELGDKVTIGGSVTIVAHYGQGGLLVISPVKIGSGCTIGIKATVMGGAQIGENAKILPHSVVLPRTIIPAGETWGGVPAKKIELNERNLKAI